MAGDRLQALLAQSAVTGIDFVYVDKNQVDLSVFFHRDPLTLDVPLSDLTRQQISIHSPSGGESLPVVPVQSIAFDVVDARNVLRVRTTEPGDFSRYRFRIDDPRIDRYFNDVGFSFKANCPSDLDCEPGPHECPPEEPVDFPVDYRARDFWSFRRALLDFASLRYPKWQDRLEADAGVMMAELFSALGDEMAYYQDRIGREAYFGTAAERRSLRRHARLVDYQVHDGLGGSTWLDVSVADGFTATIPAGATVSDARSRVFFEAGFGFRDRGRTFEARFPNEYEPHMWDEDDTCLPVGATELFVVGHAAPDLDFDDLPDDDVPGKWVLLQTSPADPSKPARAVPVRLTGIENLTDPVFGVNITRLSWEEKHATRFELELDSLRVRRNLFPATAGQTFTADFVIGPSPDPEALPEAVERTGPNGSTAYLFSLPGSDAIPLTWLGADTASARPEVRVVELVGGVEDDEWQWRRALIGTNSSQSSDADFTLDDGIWKRVAGYRRVGGEIVHADYASGAGVTIRFGDGEFGRVPPPGTVFRAEYRLGNGAGTNIAPGTLTQFVTPIAGVDGVTNPVPGEGGVDAETPSEVRQLAPDAFRSVTFRAVRTEDYAEAVERLPWVQRAGATLLWTGSWNTVFVTPDPRDAVSVTEPQRAEMFDQIDRFRQAGREAYGMDPVFANLDLMIRVCVEPGHFAGDVKEAVTEALGAYFDEDNFTFGTPLHRSTLEAAIQAVPGVRAVISVRFRRRGFFGWRNFSTLVYTPALNEVIRVENDPEFPERGSFKLFMEGGA